MHPILTRWAESVSNLDRACRTGQLATKLCPLKGLEPMKRHERIRNDDGTFRPLPRARSLISTRLITPIIGSTYSQRAAAIATAAAVIGALLLYWQVRLDVRAERRSEELEARVAREHSFELCAQADALLRQAARSLYRDQNHPDYSTIDDIAPTVDKFQAMEDSIREARHLCPEAPSLHRMAVLLAYSKDRLLGQLRTYSLSVVDQQLQLHSDDPFLLSAKATILTDCGEHAGALALEDRSILLGNTDARMFYNRGLTHKRLRQLDSAAADFRAAIDRNPAFYHASYELAEVLQEIGDFEGAVPRYREYLRAAPDALDGLVGLAHTQRRYANKTGQRSDWIVAREAYAKCLALQPTDCVLNYWAAMASAQLQDTPTALRHFAACAECSDPSQDCLHDYAVALWQDGQRELAIETMQRLVQLAPSVPRWVDDLTTMQASEQDASRR